MITGSVSGPDETFAVGEAVRAVLSDDQVRRSTSGDQFQERARVVVTSHRPGCSEGFVRYVTEVAWAEHIGSAPAARENHSTRQPGTEHSGRDVPAPGEEETR